MIQGTFSLQNPAKGKGGDKYTGNLSNGVNSEELTIYVPQSISRPKKIPLNDLNVSILFELSTTQSDSCIQCQMVKQAKGKGGDRYENNDREENFNIYIPQCFSRIDSSVRPNLFVVFNTSDSIESETGKRKSETLSSSSTTSTSTTEPEKSKKSSKTSKSPSAYNLFYKEERQRIQKENPSITQFGEVTRLVSQAWSELSSEQKQIWLDQASALKSSSSSLSDPDAKESKKKKTSSTKTKKEKKIINEEEKENDEEEFEETEEGEGDGGWGEVPSPLKKLSTL